MTSLADGFSGRNAASAEYDPALPTSADDLPPTTAPPDGSPPSVTQLDPPCLIGALELLAKGLPPVVLRASGESYYRDSQDREATGKEPRFGEFGYLALSATEALLRATWERYPGSGLGVLLGLYTDRPARSIKGLIDLEVDDPDAAGEPLRRIWPDGPPDTVRFESSGPGRWHYLFEIDEATARRLREIGISQAVLKGLHTHPDGRQAGDPAYPGLEIRFGNLIPGWVSNTLSVAPPTPRADGTPRAWVGDWLLPFPQALFDDLARYSAAAIKHRAAQVAAAVKPEPLPREELRGLTPLQKILCQLGALGIKVKRTYSDPRYKSYESCCPAHADNRPSFTFSEGSDYATGHANGKAVVKCFAGCTTDKIVTALGLWQVDLFPESDELARSAAQRRPGINTVRVAHPRPVVPDLPEELRDRFEADHERCRAALAARPDKLAELSRRLGGVSTEALEVLGVGWRASNSTIDRNSRNDLIEVGPAWTFPMFDGEEQLVNLQRRFEDETREKRGMWQGRLGLFVPRGWKSRPGPIYMPEGASDTAALWQLGYRAIGRPSNTAGVDYAAVLLDDVDAPIRIVGENDARDGHWPGDPRPFCEPLRHELPEHDIDWVLPPEGCKDMREYLADQILRSEVHS
ncbi:MAG: bifunctional DNA primase/polymerase [Isosphaeraceae bacterium]|nr:bifunctional DNA primase/polymerase [Isosphaeraceae bacterium]